MRLVFHALFFGLTYLLTGQCVNFVANQHSDLNRLQRGAGAPWYVRALSGFVTGLIAQFTFAVLNQVLGGLVTRILALVMASGSLGLLASRQIEWISRTRAAVFGVVAGLIGAWCFHRFGEGIGRIAVAGLTAAAIGLALVPPQLPSKSNMPPANSYDPPSRTIVGWTPARIPGNNERNSKRWLWRVPASCFSAEEFSRQSLSRWWAALSIATMVMLASVVSGCGNKNVEGQRIAHSGWQSGQRVELKGKVLPEDERQSVFILDDGTCKHRVVIPAKLRDQRPQQNARIVVTGIVERSEANQNPKLRFVTYEKQSLRDQFAGIAASAGLGLMCLPVGFLFLVWLIWGPKRTGTSDMPPIDGTSLSSRAKDPPTMRPSPGRFLVVSGLDMESIEIPEHTGNIITICRDARRAEENGFVYYVVVPSRFVSELHGELRFRPERGDWAYVGGATTNPTYLDGTFIPHLNGKSLKPGSLLEIRADDPARSVVLRWEPKA